MKISRVLVQNYRSVEELTIPIKHGCQVLLGINESGKSNILRALQLLDPAVDVKPADLRIERQDEDHVTTGMVRFAFSLDEAEMTQVISAVLQYFEQNSADRPIVRQNNGVVLTISEFCRLRSEFLYKVELPSGKRSATTWRLDEGAFKIDPGWHRNKDDSVVSIRPNINSDVLIPAKGFVYIQDLEAHPKLEPFTATDLNNIISIEVRKIGTNNLPKCIFWKYSDQYLLPSSIDVNAFIQNPDSCIPLRSMFELANYKIAELEPILSTAKAHSHHRYVSVLRKVADAATKHIRDVWKDHKGVRIELQPHGELLIPLVIDDQVPLDMASRSDGFKRFVSFLLQVSAKVRTNELKDVLLLVDEPEIALHPAGARSLARELFDIGKNNTVIYSTHSIFMVDRNTIDRHLIVEKKNEITKTKRAEKSKILDEEVLYAAVGYSIFETLRMRNVIFEGWRDKELFRVLCSAMGKADKQLKEDMAEIGITFAEGVKDVKHIARFLELANRGCLIISDSDNAAIQKKKEYEKIGAWGKWVTLQDILEDRTTLTAEDLISRTTIIKKSNKFRTTRSWSTANALSFGTTESAIGALRRWLMANGLEGDALEEALTTLKTDIFQDLKREDISDVAERLVTYVRAHDFHTSSPSIGS